MPTISFLFCLSEPDRKVDVLPVRMILLNDARQLACNFADEDVPFNYALRTREA